MNKNDKDLQEARKLNQQSRSGSASGFTSSTDMNSPELQEARTLNSQSASSNSSLSSGTNASMTNMSSNSDIEEAKKLNQQSRQKQK